MKEVFLTLLGHPAFHIKEANMFDAFTPAERDMLQQFVTIGERYYRIECFVYDNDSTSLLEASFDALPREEGDCTGKVRSVYLSAVAEELKPTLQRYKATLVDAERKYTNSRCWGLEAVYVEVFPYESLFALLAEFVNRVLAERIAGPALMEFVTTSKYRAAPETRDIFAQLAKACGQVFCRQLCSWLKRGEAMDCFGEFFAREHARCERIEVVESLVPRFVSKQTVEHMIFIRQKLHLLLSQAKDPTNAVSNDVEQMTNRLCELFEGDHLLDIDLERFFDHWHTAIAKRVWTVVAENHNFRSFLSRLKNLGFLFRGDVVDVFLEESEPLFKAEEINHAIMSSLKAKFSNALLRFADRDGRRSPPPVTLQLRSPAAGGTHNGDTLNNRHSFGYISGAMSSDVTKSALRQQLTTSSSTEVSATLESADDGRRRPSSKVLQSGSPPVDAPWGRDPLNNVELCFDDRQVFADTFDDTFFEVANCVFRLLLRTARLHRNLCLCWTQAMKQRVPLSVEQVKRRKLRIAMLNFIENLRYYLQVLVIDALWRGLLHEFNEHRNVELASQATRRFASELAVSCFLSTSPVYCVMSKMLVLSEEYCHYVSSVMAGRMEPSGQLMHDYYVTFQQNSYDLFLLLSSETIRQQIPSCSLLLSCMDFSGYSPPD